MTGRRDSTTREPLAVRNGKKGDLAGTLWEASAAKSGGQGVGPRVVDGWGELSHPWPTGGLAGARLGSPGLWRRVPDGQAERAVFELSAQVLAAAERDDPRGRRVLLDWADAAAAGELPDGWTAPDPADLGTTLDGAALTVRRGSSVVQGRLIREERRLALRATFGPAPADPARRAWLDDFLADAAATWRLVRAELDGSASAELVAEVDLSGAPHAVIEPLLASAATSLRWWVGWSLPGISALGDQSLSSAVLDRPPIVNVSDSLQPS